MLIPWALAAAVVLEGFAMLPGDTFMPGPPSGQFIAIAPGIERPFKGQPAQGFSAIAPYGGGSYYALTDNGFGTAANSADFVLRIYLLTPEFRTAGGGSGEVSIDGYINLSDPMRRLGFAATHQHHTYYGHPVGTAVHEAIREQALLTGADLDPESLVVDQDGSFWIGDEFGPFLLHFGATGELLESPYGVPALATPDRPGLAPGDANLRRSAGFEGLAALAGGRELLPMLEASLTGQSGILNIYGFDVESRRFTLGDEPVFRYRLDGGSTAIGAFRLTDGRQGLIIERDDGQGPTARSKRIYRVDLDAIDAEGMLVKQLVADLLDISDPHDLNGDGDLRFSFPHQTIESVLLLDAGRMLVVNDNNFPFGRARRAGRPDATEFIIIRMGD